MKWDLTPGGVERFDGCQVFTRQNVPHASAKNEPYCLNFFFPPPLTAVTLSTFTPSRGEIKFQFAELVKVKPLDVYTTQQHSVQCFTEVLKVIKFYLSRWHHMERHREVDLLHRQQSTTCVKNQARGELGIRGKVMKAELSAQPSEVLPQRILTSLSLSVLPFHPLLAQNGQRCCQSD